ncbi:MAG: hypothetical protein KDA51_01770, partial [Planctomycetales bacterium]|nr:hypothetical protein [Planctomycetales bacterium]
MNQTPENRAALRHLAVEPMRAAGLEYAEPALAWEMLARMNYYPSLVQVFGRQIIESVGRKPLGKEGPRWLLHRETLFEGEVAERIANQIRDRFQLTLNLDLRYECIAKSIALHRLDTAGGDAKVLTQGLSAPEIASIALQNWPGSLSKPTVGDFEELLREMVDLGVLGRFPQDRYGLRNAQVAQMLGLRDTLESDLLALMDRENEPSYDAAEFHTALRPLLPEERAPFADRVMERLFDLGMPGLRIAIVPEAIVGTEAANRLKVAAAVWLGGKHALVSPEEARIRKALDACGSDPQVLVIDGPWKDSTATALSRHPAVIQGRCLPIWCLEFLPTSEHDWEVYRASTWSEAMLRHWLVERGLASALDDVETRRAI